MPHGSIPFGAPNKQVLVTWGARNDYGKLGYLDSITPNTSTGVIAAQFAVCTGGNNLSDITYNQAAAVTLLGSNFVPSNMRAYITSARIKMLGNTAWTSGSSVTIEDTNGAPLIFIPLSGLKPQLDLIFPDAQTNYPITLTASSFASGTGVITFPATSFVNASYIDASAPAVVTVIAGTGAGQSARILSNTATTITPVGGAAAFPVALDNTSVCAISYWVATAGAGTTVTLASQAGSATPLTANYMEDNNLTVQVTSGTAVGQSRFPAANTTSVITVPTWTTNPAAGDLVCLSTAPQAYGALDLCTAGQAAAGLGKGLRVAVNGTMGGGSPLRVMVNGYFAP